ncbi:hypothetical protein Tco_1426765 [Tanacetum coccineum]
MLNRHKNWLVHKQTACGKDFSNPFMVDNLPKIVRFSTHLASVVKSWLVHDQTVHALASPKANELTIPEQTATGKGTSNPLMADTEFIAEIQGNKWLPTTADLDKMKFAHNNILKSQCKTGAEYEYHLLHIEDFMNNQIVWESR